MYLLCALFSNLKNVKITDYVVNKSNLYINTKYILCIMYQLCHHIILCIIIQSSI